MRADAQAKLAEKFRKRVLRRESTEVFRVDPGIP